MSAIYFTAPEREVTVRGPERSAMAMYVNQALERHLGEVLDRHPERVWELVAPGWRPELERANRKLFLSALHTYRDDLNPMLRWKGASVEPFTLALNTAVRTGEPGFTLAARIHGQCEIHGWVDGPDRRWFAGLLSAGLDRGFLRREMRWEQVVKLLEESSADPVVTSYSVTEIFPDSWEAGWLPKASEEARGVTWEALSGREQFGVAMAALKRRGGRLQWSPGDWSGYRFGLGLAAQDLLADDWRECLDRAVAPHVSQA